MRNQALDMAAFDSAGASLFEGPWGISGASDIYWGRIVHRCRSDIKRCEEEMPILQVEKIRCDMHVGSGMQLVEQGGPQGSGKGMLLKRWRDLLESIASQIAKLKW